MSPVDGDRSGVLWASVPGTLLLATDTVYHMLGPHVGTAPRGGGPEQEEFARDNAGQEEGAALGNARCLAERFVVTG